MSVCGACHGGCCRKFNVHLTGYDIVNIAQKLDLNYILFTQVTPVQEKNIDKISKHTALFKFPNLGDGYYTFYLRRIKSKYMLGSLKCMFLQEWNGEDFLLPSVEGITARCGIYETRPLVCANYPISLSKDGLTGITGDPNKLPEILDSSVSNENPAYDLCPRALTEEDFSDFSGDTIKNLVYYNYEVKYFKSLAEAWNKNPSDFGKFFIYLEMAYNNRVLFCDNNLKDELN